MSSTFSLNTTLEHIADRIKDPFLGAYSFFLVTYNWKIFLYLFSELSLHKTISGIEELMSIKSILCPLVITIAFFVLTPFLRTVVRFILQLLQRVDDKVSKVPMDKEKVELIDRNTRLLSENAKLTTQNHHLVEFKSKVQYCLSQNKNSIVYINENINELDPNDHSVATFANNAHDLVKGVTTLENNLNDLDSKYTW